MDGGEANIPVAEPESRGFNKLNNSKYEAQDRSTNGDLQTLLLLLSSWLVSHSAHSGTLTRRRLSRRHGGGAILRNAAMQYGYIGAL